MRVNRDRSAAERRIAGVLVPQLDPALVTVLGVGQIVRLTGRANQKVGGEPGPCDRRCRRRFRRDYVLGGSHQLVQRCARCRSLSSCRGNRRYGIDGSAIDPDSAARGPDIGGLAEQSSLRFALIRTSHSFVQRQCVAFVSSQPCFRLPGPPAGSNPRRARRLDEQLGRRRQRDRRTLRARRRNGRGARPARRGSKGRADRVGRQSYRSRSANRRGRSLPRALVHR